MNFYIFFHVVVVIVVIIVFCWEICWPVVREPYKIVWYPPGVFLIILLGQFLELLLPIQRSCCSSKLEQ